MSQVKQYVKYAKTHAELFTISIESRCSRERRVSSTSSVMPRMPFIGVRISWLMLARKSLLARLAASAASLAYASRRSVHFRSIPKPIPSATEIKAPSTAGVSGRRE